MQQERLGAVSSVRGTRRDDAGSLSLTDTFSHESRGQTAAERAESLTYDSVCQWNKGKVPLDFLNIPELSEETLQRKYSTASTHACWRSVCGILLPNDFGNICCCHGNKACLGSYPPLSRRWTSPFPETSGWLALKHTHTRTRLHIWKSFSESFRYSPPVKPEPTTPLKTTMSTHTINTLMCNLYALTQAGHFCLKLNWNLWQTWSR